MNIVIKKEFLDTPIGFGKSSLPLGQRKDLVELAILAHESKDPSISQFFEDLPPLADLKKAKTDIELKSIRPVIEEKPTEQEIIDNAVPKPFNKNTKVGELNDKPPASTK